MEYKKGIESSHKRKRTSSDSCGHWRQEHRGVGPYYTLSCPHSRSRVQHSVRGHTREVRWTVTPREGKNSDSSDSKKIYYSYVLTCSVDFFGFCFLLFPPSTFCSCQFYWHYEIWLSFGVFVFFFPPSITFFIVVINLYLYLGILQFCGVFLFFSLFLNLIFNFLNLL